jgi:phosphoribosylformimino-5-aminoimidazole carboxamide ribotide isomerase
MRARLNSFWMGWLVSLVLYAAVDLLGGRCVRPLRGEDGQISLVEDDPLTVARRWQEAGIPWLHVADLDGARDSTPTHSALVRALAEASGLPIQYAGGLRTEEDVAEVFAHGAARAILGTAAAHDEKLLSACLARWGERVAVSLEARGDAVTVAGWLESASETVAHFARHLVEAGVRTLLMTAVEKDGSLADGVSPRLLRLRASVPEAALIAGGGIVTLDDVRQLARAGVDGAVLGHALYEGRFDVAEALRVAAETATRIFTLEGTEDTEEQQGRGDARREEQAAYSAPHDEPAQGDE